MGTFGENGEESRRGTHRFPQTDHGEESTSDRRRDMGYAWVESSAGINIIQLEITYIGRRQVTMVQWVALRPLFGVYEG